MSVHVIEWGRQEDTDYVPIGPTKEMYEEVVGSTHALVCQNCGAPLTRGTYKCEYCGTEHIADIVVRNEISEMKEKQMRLEMKKRTKELEIAMQEQTARLYEMMGINAELMEIKGALLKRESEK